MPAETSIEIQEGTLEESSRKFLEENITSEEIPGGDT